LDLKEYKGNTSNISAGHSWKQTHLLESQQQQPNKVKDMALMGTDVLEESIISTIKVGIISELGMLAITSKRVAVNIPT
jgi:hypothetical protein